MNRGGHDNQSKSPVHRMLTCSPVMAHMEAADALYDLAERRRSRPKRQRAHEEVSDAGTRKRGLARWRPLLVAALILCMAVPTFLQLTAARAAGRDTLLFDNGGSAETFGANAIVRIDGSITFESNCGSDGINDFVYPATDVYVVPAGSVTGDHAALTDVSGRPNTIVSGATLFASETIAATAPVGSLDDGAYDVVYDNCQDGFYDQSVDTVFPSAITVALPDVLPLASAAITSMKDEALTDYVSWMATRGVMQGLFKLADKAIEVNCDTGSPIACAMKEVDYFDKIKEQVLALMLSEANHYLAIHADPPDPQFQNLTTVAVAAQATWHGSSALATAIADAQAPLAAENALSDALLHAVERYQGSVAAGDSNWALVHARQAGNLAAVLAQAQQRSVEALTAIRDAAMADPTLGAALDRGTTFARRLWTSGFTPDERRSLHNLGFDDQGVANLETSSADQIALTRDQFLQSLDQLLTAHAALPAASQAEATSWGAVVGQITSTTAATALTLDAGGPYDVTEGVALTLHATADSGIDRAAWDLDADGAFDDATGLTPATTFSGAGLHLVGVQVTKGGQSAVAYALVRVGDAQRPPTITAAIPSAGGVQQTAGTSQQFGVTASDPDGDPLTFTWTIDGHPVTGSGASLSYAPAVADVGVHTLDVEVSDGMISGGSIHRSWTVGVVAGDADLDGWTSTSDCNDADSAVHPTATEILGNNVDDDCDAATPDAPPGGLTGTMMSWGSNHNGSIGVGLQPYPLAPTPLAIPGFDNAVQVYSRDAGGVALLDSGEVIGWGTNYSGQLGTGESNLNQISSTPVYVLPVGGGSGHLTGVTQVSGHDQFAARRTDGSVVAWGENGAGQLGDGSTVSHRAYPVEVQAGPGLGKLTGVRAVEAGYVENYMIMDDGTVRVVGQDRCDGTPNITLQPYPKPLTLVGNGVKQVSSGQQWTLILKNDGTVLSCGGSSATAGRPVISVQQELTPGIVVGFGPGSKAVDIAAGYESGAILTSDGKVWMWGYNANGSLSAAGIAGGATAYTPIAVPLPPGPPVVDIAMDNACALQAMRADGSVLSFGCDFFEQVGDGPGGTIVDTPKVLDLGGRSAVSVTNSVWNSLVLTRPAVDSGWAKPATWVDASIADTATGESAPAHVAVSLSAALPFDVSVNWQAVPDTASADDIGATSGTVIIPAGTTQADIVVPIVDDSIHENDETFSVRLTEASNGIQFGRSIAHVTIVDNDALPSASVVQSAVTEGDTSITDATVAVHLSAPSAQVVTIGYATADGTAVAGSDYVSSTGTVQFAPGETDAVIHTTVIGDRTVEPDEQFTVSLTSADGASIATPSAALTIVDDEPLAINVSSPTVTEGNTGTTPAPFTISITPAPLAGTLVTLDYAIAGQSATVPGDVVSANGTLHFDHNTTTQILTADIVGDTDVEGSETFRLSFGSPVASDGRQVLVGDDPAAVIVDDDQPPAAGAAPVVDAGAAVSGDEGSPLALDATVSDPDPGDTANTSWTFQADSGVDAGAACSFAAPTSVDTTITCTDDGAYVATLTATDAAGHTAADTVNVTVANKAPLVQVTAPANGSSSSVGSSVSLAAAVTDPGANDTATCTINWGDGGTSAGTVNAGQCRGTHTYLVAGNPTIAVSVSDDDGASATAQVTIAITAAAHTSTATGSGKIPQGTRCTSLTFSFTARTDGATTSGSLSVNVSNHVLRSTLVDSLTVSGYVASFTGTATWDGAPNRRFVVTVEDRYHGNRRDPADTFSIKVTDPSGAVLLSGSASLSSGSITVTA